ncbi:MAG: SIS domain-containing protein [Candidatus Adiutrix sp.]|jgi:D-sedoheptulose 7-phosphate isomerase|nr:SIS domain-containing protein [Candidatus Adiutrix sp.]
MPIELARKAISDSSRAMALAPAELLAETARVMAGALAGGGSIFICGNGGSAAQAQHFAAEFVGRFLMERPALPAVALTTDASILTAVGNDYGFEEIFARQTRALLRPGDILWAISTSGRSPNVLKALEAAREAGGKTVFMCGRAAPEGVAADIILAAPGPETPRIQEMHLLYGHTLCQLVDHLLFAAPGELDKNQ